MSFLDDLKRENNVSNHKMEDAIAEEFITCLKRYIKVQHLMNHFTGVICGYAGTDHDIAGFDFKETTLSSVPGGNCGFPLSGGDMKYIAGKKSLKLKDTYDIQYLAKCVEESVCELGFVKCKVRIHLNPWVTHETVKIKKWFRTEYETKTNIIKENEFCCIYIEAES